ncbi:MULTISPECIES: hypothetical protein [unclassified Variovorax]|uniref:hypothetical protein n=1 Tax=unclassified Variovorax TaxID=663243 RepID=UPI002B239240|nr:MULTISPECIES: hypothetical protein [unclassified Variovorax]MEB0059730.1 hypothetical protein [Variovorax sp. LG9.2]MEB0114233.1 hypothetical protein [Variovorax sp. RTB1]
MTYQGERARPSATERGRFFAVSSVRLGGSGHVMDVCWREVNAASDLDVGASVVASAADVVDAIHDGAQVAAMFSGRSADLPQRLFIVIEHQDGTEALALDGPSSPGRNLADIAVFT